MSNLPVYKVFITPHFKKQLKRLLKKHPKLNLTVAYNLDYFEKQKAESIGQGVYKMRLKGQSKGKSGGYRLYIFVVEIDGYLSPICIYPKNEKGHLTYNELSWHLEKTKEELEELL